MTELLRLVATFRDEIRTQPDFQFAEFHCGISHGWCKFVHEGQSYRLRTSDERSLDLFRGEIAIAPNGIPLHPRYPQFTWPDPNRAWMRDGNANWIPRLTIDWKDHRAVVAHIIKVVRGCHWSWIYHENLGYAEHCQVCPNQLTCLTTDVSHFLKKPEEAR